MAKCEILVGYNTPQKKPILCDLQAIGKTIENGKVVNLWPIWRKQWTGSNLLKP